MPSLESVKKSIVEKQGVTDDTPAIPIFDEVFGVANWSFQGVPTHENGLIVYTGHLSYKTSGAKDETVTTNIFGVVRLTAPFMDAVNKAENRALLNFLSTRFGLQYEMSADEMPVKNVSAPTGYTPLSQSESFDNLAGKNMNTAVNASNDVCGDCQEEITAWTSKGGKFISVQQQKQMSTKNYGKPICNRCSTKRYLSASR